MVEAIVPAIEPDDRCPGIVRREATDVAHRKVVGALAVARLF